MGRISGQGEICSPKIPGVGMSWAVTSEGRNGSLCHCHGLKLTFLHPVNIALLTVCWMDCFSTLAPFPLHMGSSITITQGEGRKELSLTSSLLPSKFLEDHKVAALEKKILNVL